MIEGSEFGVRGSPFAVHRSPFVVYRSKFGGTLKVPFICANLCHLWLGVRGSGQSAPIVLVIVLHVPFTVAVRRSPFTVYRHQGASHSVLIGVICGSASVLICAICSSEFAAVLKMPLICANL
jgi:hypothetical protein